MTLSVLRHMSLPPDSRILQLQVSAPLVKMHSLWKPIKDIFLHSITFLISSKNVSHYQINIQTSLPCLYLKRFYPLSRKIAAARFFPPANPEKQNTQTITYNL